MPRRSDTDDSGRSAKWHVRRQTIIDTSAHVFAKNGYHATGVAELCDANELGKGALYHYIGSKEELLAAIHDRVMDEVMLSADRVTDAGGSPSEQLEMLGEELVGHHRPVPRSRVGLPARVPRARRASGPSSSAAGVASTSNGSRGSSVPASRRVSSATSTRGSRRSRGSACTTTRTCGCGRTAGVRRTRSRRRSPTSSSAACRTGCPSA